MVEFSREPRGIFWEKDWCFANIDLEETWLLLGAKLQRACGTQPPMRASSTIGLIP